MTADEYYGGQLVKRALARYGPSCARACEDCGR
ncbi:hypothetical protein [Pseudomonas avellanae]